MNRDNVIDSIADERDALRVMVDELKSYVRHLESEIERLKQKEPAYARVTCGPEARDPVLLRTKGSCL